MRDQLRALAKLAKMDEAAKDFDEELKTLPQRIEAMRQDVDTLEKLLVHERSQLEEAQKLRQKQNPKKVPSTFNWGKLTWN